MVHGDPDSISGQKDLERNDLLPLLKEEWQGKIMPVLPKMK
jgi:hypothetical protein